MGNSDWLAGASYVLHFPFLIRQMLLPGTSTDGVDGVGSESNVYVSPFNPKPLHNYGVIHQARWRYSWRAYFSGKCVGHSVRTFVCVRCLLKGAELHLLPGKSSALASGR